MPSDFPRSPKFLKGALVSYESQFIGVVPNVIVFQYNPEQLSRSLAQRTITVSEGAGSKAKEETQRVEGPPVESINLSIVLNAADQLEDPVMHPLTVAKGIYPALSALELLFYPPSSQFVLFESLAAKGCALLKPQDAPLVLFVWGPSRVLPVQLTSFSVTEESFDQQLNPIQAKLELGMKVLTYLELKKESLAHGAYLAAQIQKEAMALLNVASKVAQITGMLPV